MNKIKRFLCLGIAMIICLLSMASCIFNKLPDESHLCSECGKCPDPECECSEKCEGHTSDPVHECESVCEKCHKCLDTECTDDACAEKCEGHEPIEVAYGLKVMSFNLDQAYGTDSSKQKKILSKIMEEIPDVIGVQEETPGWEGFLVDALKNEGYVRVGKYRATQPSHAYYGYREASAIYYNADRFELIDSDTFWLSPTPEVEGSVATGWSSEALFPRVCTWVILKDRLSGFEFAYFNSHFSYEAEVIRNESAKLIVSRIQESGIPAFFSGDLNFASNEETDTYNAITEYMDDSRIVANETMDGNTFHNYGYGAGESYGSGSCKTVPIDYIFATKGDFEALTFRILSESGDKGDASDYYSDHFAIVATYEYVVSYEQ